MKMNKTNLLAVSLAGLMGWGGVNTALAICPDAQREVVAIALIATAAGYSIEGGIDCKLLPKGGIDLVKATLLANQHYKLVAGGCNDAYDVDVLVLDENRNVVAKDTTTTKLAEVDIVPRWTGEFYIGTQMHNSTANGAHINMLLLRK
ncbi:exported hypothetical protein [Gammaproteobacteria bacterium]